HVGGQDVTLSHHHMRRYQRVYPHRRHDFSRWQEPDKRSPLHTVTRYATSTSFHSPSQTVRSRLVMQSHPLQFLLPAAVAVMTAVGMFLAALGGGARSARSWARRPRRACRA